MKKTNRFLAAMTASLLALTPLAATGIMTATAADITISASHTSSSEFAAYQIFTGTVENNKLKGIAWGSAIPTENISTMLTELQGNDTFKVSDTNVFASLTASSDPKDFSDAFAKFASKSDGANELAKILGKYVTTAVTDGNASTKQVIEGVDSGYYLVKETSSISNDNPLSLNLLEVVGSDVTIIAKEDLPSLTKEITSSNQNPTGNANVAAIGDTVSYKLTSAVPNMEGYNKYFFVINDDLSSGLTFDPSSVVVTINGSALDSSSYEIQQGAAADSHTFQIVFNNFIQYKNLKTSPIIVTYNATLNSNAVITDAGNPNDANLTYSNNPNYTYTGDTDNNTPNTPDEPASGEPTGVTPTQEVKTYTTAIKIKKVDQNNAPLTGAKFKLEGTNLNEVKITSAETFEEDANGTYYLLNDGSYTLTEPPTDTSDPNYAKYDLTNISKKFKKTTTTAGTIVETATGSPLSVEAEVDSNGFITFYGLKPGTYTLTETVVPNGYNGVSPESFLLKAAPTTSSAQWSFRNTGDTADYDKFALNSTDSVYEITIKNRAGAQLPSTGGMGTKLLYAFGSVFAIGSATFIVTRKRMNNSK